MSKKSKLEATPSVARPVPFDLDTAPLERSSSSSLIRRLFKGYMKPHRGSFIIAFIFMSISAATTGGLAKMIEPMVDGLGQGKGDAYVYGLAGGIMGLFGLRGMAVYIHTIIMNRIGQRIITDVQQEMHDHLLGLDLAFFHANASGKLMSRVTNDVAVMRYAVGECMTSAFKGVLTLVCLIAVMFYQDWKLSLVAFLVFPASGFFVARIGKAMRRYSTHTQEETGRFSALLSQIFQGMRHVKAYGMEQAEHDRVQKVTETIYNVAVKSFKVSALSNPMAEILSGIAITTVILYGSWQIQEGLTTAGALFSFITAFVLAYDPMKRTAKINAQLQAGLAAAQRVFQILDVKPTILDPENKKELNSNDASVRLDQALFVYPDGTLALDHVTLDVPAGQTVALVGSSGAGKSTIINLIPRFYDLEGGQILIGSTNIRDVTLKSLRENIALVSQETALFDDSVRGNIAYGKQGASDAEIEEAAKAAFADAFIKELPQGYDTIVGEQGIKLSGGQRQRIVIARAMLRNAPILLLDEATSALDNESERAVQAALKRLQEGRTTIVVAHRLSTIVDADKIVVLDQGKVAEQGKHDALLAQGGLYAKLYGMQKEDL